MEAWRKAAESKSSCDTDVKSVRPSTVCVHLVWFLPFTAPLPSAGLGVRLGNEIKTDLSQALESQDLGK